MRGFFIAAIVGMSAAALAAAPPNASLRGFTTEGSARERLIESQFVDVPTAASALDTVTAVAARPHYAGTPADYDLALYMRDRLRAAGVAAELESFSTTVETPRELVLEVAPPADLDFIPSRKSDRRRRNDFPLALDLRESAQAADPPTAARSVGLPFEAGSADGDVRGPLVYAAHGSLADYHTLEQARTDVAGAILLVRSGAESGTVLAARAQAHGAAGLIFYSDPKDDGPNDGAAYPDGPRRAQTSVERGWVGSGIHIPVLPISALNARVLLASLHGPPGPADWEGGLPVAYPIARGPGRVHLIVKLDRKPATLWNTIGVIPGVHPEQSAIVGAHRDAWVYGAVDNGAGVATVVEVARGLGALLHGGWRPERSIILAGWDGGSIGSAGSRSYIERHRVEIGRGCIAYFDADSNVTGSQFGAAADAALAPLLVELSHDVHDPIALETTVYNRWAAQTLRRIPRADVPGGDGDDTRFLQTANVPIGTMRFSGPFGVDGSSYDTLRFATTFSDPEFGLHRTIAQLYGLAALRVADATNVPYTLSVYPSLLRGGLRQLVQTANQSGVPLDTGKLRRSIDDLSVAIARSDRIVRSATRDITPNEIAAVHVLDSLVYGASGRTRTVYPELGAAIASHDAAHVSVTIREATDLIESATSELQRSL